MYWAGQRLPPKDLPPPLPLIPPNEPPDDLPPEGALKDLKPPEGAVKDLPPMDRVKLPSVL